MQKLLLITVIFIGISISFNQVAMAQPPPPPPAIKGSGDVKKWEPPSLATLTPGDVYRPWEGRFSIRLKSSMMSGYSAITPESAGAPRSGGSYNWRVKEGELLVQYFDSLEDNLAKASPDELEKILAASLSGGIQRVKGTDIKEAPVKLGSIPGRKAKFKIAGGETMYVRNFIDGNRMYLIVARVTAKEPAAADLAEDVLDSFKILSQAEVDADVEKAIEASMPEPLPQSPVVRREKSDAEDEDLKGRVRSVIAEDKDLSGTWQNQLRHRSSIEEYDEKGNLTKRISYDSTGYPFDINVYGYIDGARVSKSKTLKGGSGFTISAAGTKKEEKPRDMRYGFKRLYKYSKGRLAEMKLFTNDGEIWMTYTYIFEGDTKTELVYSQDGKLNQKYVYKLDAKGNPTEYFRYDAFKNPEKVQRSYRYRYDAFDEKGNWTQRTRFESVREQAVDLEVPSLIEYRTISYYP